MKSTNWKGKLALKNRSAKISLSLYCIIIVALFAISGLTLTFGSSRPTESKSIATNGINRETGAAVEPAKSPVLLQGFVQGQQPTQVSEVELITITPDGFEPAVITRPPGLFVIAYENRSGIGNLNVQIINASTDLFHNLTVPLMKNMWVGEFNLPSDKYFIIEASHPEWQCALTID